ncbi:extensin-like [Helianthus annuus]|uniref:extensin-like n=1 Tax=Helianthus annuus TaxID=4232 RepID=UPI000B8F82AE|nr:extensin-like [Helianthus annuus]
MEHVEQPQPPQESPRRKRGARMSVRMRQRSGSLPPLLQAYLPIPKDPQIGGPSNAVPVVDLTPQNFVQPPPSGFDNPIPTYTDTTGYHPFNPSTPIDYNYQAPAYDPYLQVVVHNALYPSPFLPAYLATRYPNYGYKYPVVPQPQPQPPPKIEAFNQALERVEQIQR